MHMFDFQIHEIGLSSHQVTLTVVRHSILSDDVISITPLMVEAEIDACRDTLKRDLDVAADRAKKAMRGMLVTYADIEGVENGL